MFIVALLHRYSIAPFFLPILVKFLLSIVILFNVFYFKLNAKHKTEKGGKLENATNSPHRNKYQITVSKVMTSMSTKLASD